MSLGVSGTKAQSTKLKVVASIFAMPEAVKMSSLESWNLGVSKYGSSGLNGIPADEDFNVISLW